MTAGGRRALRRRGQPKYRAIPRHRPGENPDAAIQALTEVVEVLVGARNDPYYRAITWADLLDSGVVTQIQDNFTGVIVPGDPTGPIPPGTIPGIDTPTTPAGVGGGGTFNAGVIYWDYPIDYYGHAYTEIWRAIGVDDLGQAVLIAQVTGRFFRDVLDPGTQAYYWIRFVNVEGVPGPFHSAGGGLFIETAILVTDIMAAMNDLLDAGDLSTSLQDEIAIGAAVETFLETNWSIESAVDNGGNIRVSGMKLINGQGQLSKIIFNTDVFAVAPPFDPASDEEGEAVFLIGPWTDPLSDPENPTVINRVVMANTVIGDLTVGEAAIQALRADKITVAGVPGDPSTIAEVIIGSGHIDDLMIGNYIQSANWNPLTFQGWKFTRGPFPTSTIEIFGSIHIRDPSTGATILDAGGGSYGAAIANSAQNYSQVIGIPTELSDINSAEGDKLDGIEAGATANVIYQSPTEPVGGQDGDFWFQPATGRLYKFNIINGWELAADGTLQHFVDIGLINISNRGTYIADAAMDTLVLQGDILVLVGYDEGGAVSVGSGSTVNLCAVSITIPNVGQGTNGSRVLVNWNVCMDGQNSDAHGLDLRLMRGAEQWSQDTSDRDDWASGTFAQNLSPGTYTYTLQMRRTGYSGTVSVNSSGISVGTIKK